MNIDRMPADLVPGRGPLNFDQDTIPDALQREHSLGAGLWGNLHVLEGSLRFVDLAGGQERLVSAPDTVIIRPGQPHKVVLEGDVRCRIDFFREAGTGHAAREPAG